MDHPPQSPGQTYLAIFAHRIATGSRGSSSRAHGATMGPPWGHVDAAGPIGYHGPMTRPNSIRGKDRAATTDAVAVAVAATAATTTATTTTAAATIPELVEVRVARRGPRK